MLGQCFLEEKKLTASIHSGLATASDSARSVVPTGVVIKLSENVNEIQLAKGISIFILVSDIICPLWRIMLKERVWGSMRTGRFDLLQNNLR